MRREAVAAILWAHLRANNIGISPNQAKIIVFMYINKGAAYRRDIATWLNTSTAYVSAELERLRRIFGRDMIPVQANDGYLRQFTIHSDITAMVPAALRWAIEEG